MTALVYKNEWPCNHKRRRRGTWGLQPPKLDINPFHPGKFSERTIGNRAESLQNVYSPLNLTCSYAMLATVRSSSGSSISNDFHFLPETRASGYMWCQQYALRGLGLFPPLFQY